MIINDGQYEIYLIQNTWISYKDHWTDCLENEDYFKESSMCYKDTGIHSTYDIDEARVALEKMIQKDNRRKFRIVKIKLSKITEEVQ